MQSAPQAVSVKVVDQNDNAPVLTESGSLLTFNEGTFSAETATGLTFSATDPDSSAQLEISVGGDSRFSVNSDDGSLVIIAGSEFDYETEADRSIELTVEVTDGTYADSKDVTIDFSNINDVLPTITSSLFATLNTGHTYSSSALIYLARGTFDAVPIEWSLLGGSGEFEIDSASGAVTFKNSTTTPNLEAAEIGYYSFTVVATSGDLFEMYQTVEVVLSPGGLPFNSQDQMEDHASLFEEDASDSSGWEESTDDTESPITLDSWVDDYF